MKIKGVKAKAIKDSRGEKTICISIKTSVGKFSASAPNGKSKGKFEAKPYKKSLEGDIKFLKESGEYFADEYIDKFEDLRRIEDIVEGHVGANSLFALESAALKAIAKEKKKKVWQIINPNAKVFPRLVGNVIEGGQHSKKEGKKPDFQEFLLIPNSKSVKESFEKNLKAKKEAETILKELDNEFSGKKTDENAWQTSLNEKIVLDILYRLKEKFKVDIGIDVAASSFSKRKKYNYKNPMLNRSGDEQFGYISNLVKNYSLFYVEDGFEEEDFEGFAKLLKKYPESLIVGDDLVVTNHKRLLKAIQCKSVNAIIVKPNQNGSLLAVKQVCDTARENGIKIVFSHRSGETKENILADLAFGFQADFFKCGIDGKEREAKLKRLIDIEKGLK